MNVAALGSSVQTKQLDVDVVGAGPGGCMLSYLLARSGVRTVLLERHQRLDREFRGYFFQPLVLKLFDQIGLLENILQIPHQHVDVFKFIDRGKTLFEVRFDELDLPYNFGLNIPQPLLLEYFVQEASRFPNFTYFSGTMAKELIKQGDSVHGLRARSLEGDIELNSRLVVGADGRYSTIRESWRASSKRWTILNSISSGSTCPSHRENTIRRKSKSRMKACSSVSRKGKTSYRSVG